MKIINTLFICSMLTFVAAPLEQAYSQEITAEALLKLDAKNQDIKLSCNSSVFDPRRCDQ